MNEPTGNARPSTSLGLKHIALTAALSMIGSAGTSAYILSSNVTKIGVVVEDHERRIASNEKVVSKTVQDVASLKAQQDEADKFRSEILAQLNRIEDKLDRTIERRSGDLR